MKLLEKFTDELLNGKEKREIRIKIYGDISPLGRKLQDNIKKLEEATKNYDKMVLGICLNYGGRDEILRATKNIAKNLVNGNIKDEDINEKLFANYLYTTDIPDPDLIIRTSNEYRLSNFLTWQSTYSELYFPKDIMWPDFNEKQFDIAIEEYIKRNRRFGGN